MSKIPSQFFFLVEPTPRFPQEEEEEEEEEEEDRKGNKKEDLGVIPKERGERGGSSLRRRGEEKKGKRCFLPPPLLLFSSSPGQWEGSFASQFHRIADADTAGGKATGRVEHKILRASKNIARRHEMFLPRSLHETGPAAFPPSVQWDSLQANLWRKPLMSPSSSSSGGAKNKNWGKWGMSDVVFVEMDSVL